MTAFEIIRRVEALGGSLRVDGPDLKVAAPAPLPDELLAEVAEYKPAIMIALGAPMDSAVASILGAIRPYLAPALKKLPDDRLLALVNWNIIAAWETAVRNAGEGIGRKTTRGGAR
jgi:hypothetical protein